MEGSRESQGDRLMPMTFDWLASDGGALDHRLASPAAAARTAAPRVPVVRPTTISRRRFLATVAAVAAAGAPRPARGGTAVKIGTAVLGDYSMAGPVIVALERGFFAREGLEAEFVPFRGGPDLLKAVMGGDVLVGITGSTDILVFREAGSPIKMVATHTEGNHFTLNVAPDVSSVAGLKGKAIGVTRVGATTWIFARMLAKKEGWDPDKDVQIVGLGGLDAQHRSSRTTSSRRSCRSRTTSRESSRLSGSKAWILAGLVLAAPPGAARAQVFLATRPHPDFTIGPLFVRATVTPALGTTAVDVLWSLVIPPTKSATDLEQDLYLLWPDEVDTLRVEGKPDPDLARYVEARGDSLIGDGRLPLYAQGLYRTGPQTKPEPSPGGAPFVSFVRQGGPLGLTSPATYMRIPWTPLLANRTWLIRLGMGLPRLVRPRPATWVEDLFWGHRYTISLAFNDVRGRALFPLYLENRDRVIRLADEPSQLLINFTHAEHLKIQDVFPGTATRRMSETLESTQVVSAFLERAQGATPQVLTVQFGYFTGWQSWAPVLIPMIFFVLGNLAGPLLTLLVKRVGGRLSGRIHISPRSAPVERQTGTVVSRETLGRIAPGSTTYEEVIRLCGADHEEHEEPLAPDRDRKSTRLNSSHQIISYAVFCLQ